MITQKYLDRKKSEAQRETEKYGFMQNDIHIDPYRLLELIEIVEQSGKIGREVMQRVANS